MDSMKDKQWEYKSFIGLPGGGEINRCYYPFKLDTYGKGCSNNCLYCYARSCLSFRNLWNANEPARTDVSKVSKLFQDVFDKSGLRKHSELLLNRIPLRLGSMTDCFSDVERKRGITRQVIEILNRYDYPYLILTKNSLIADYVDILDTELAYIQFSITTPYDDVSRIYEQNASLTSERLQAVQTLSSRGFYTAVRINPLFPIRKDGYYSNKLRANSNKLQYFDWNLVDLIAEAGARTVIAGFLRLSSWNLKWIEEATGDNLRWLFDDKQQFSNQSLHFSTEEKRYYYERIKLLCDEKGLDFSVCYDGDEDYETFRYLWANPDDCCNGKSNVTAFQKAMDFENPDFYR